MEELEDQIGTEMDLEGEGLSGSGHGGLGVAQDAGDQEQRGSEDKSAEGQEEGQEKEDRYEYKLPDGTKFEGTFEEIVAKVAETKVASLEEELQALKTQQEQKPTEDKKPEEGEELPYEIRPLQLNKVGEVFQTMLDGGDPEQGIGGIETVGPQLQEFVFQTYAQDPRFADLMYRFVNGVIEQRDRGIREEASFKEFAGAEVKDTDLAAFQKANPHLKTRNEAILGMQLANMRQELSSLKADKEKAVKEAEAKGKQTGETETVKNLKFKGNLRHLGSGRSLARELGGEGPNADLKSKFDITDPDQRTLAMTEAILRKRGQGSG